MIAKKTKILALAVVGMMCAVAIVGAAYAAFAGEARTYNENNTAEVGYITVTPGTTAAGDWTAITASSKAVFDTYVFNGGSVYYFNSAGVAGTDDAANYTVKELTTATKQFTIANQTDANITAVNIAVKAAAAVGNNDFKYFLKVTSTDGNETTNVIYIAVDTAGSNVNLSLAEAITANGGSKVVTVALCVGYTADYYIPVSYIGPAITKATYDGYDAEQKALYSQLAKNSTSGPVDITDLDLAFTITDATA